MKKHPGDLSLWLAVGGLFALLLGAWVTLFSLAARHPVPTVPLEHRTAPAAPEEAR